MQLVVLVYFDHEARNWFFRVPALHLIGGGQATREMAEQAALEAIAYCLDPETQIAGEEQDYKARIDYPVTISSAGRVAEMATNP